MEKKAEANEILSVIRSDVKKLITHFKLDRRKQGEEETPAKVDYPASYTMLEDIKSKLDELANRPVPEASVPTQAPAGPLLDSETVAEIRELKQALEKTAEEVGVPQRHIHQHTLDFMSNKALIILVVVMVGLIVSLWVVRNQRDTIKQFRDNDLKYRHIQMQGKAEPGEILKLRNIFDYNRNADSIRIIRQRVERYEQLIQEESERQARARLNAEEAEKLRQEAETVKGNR